MSTNHSTQCIPDNCDVTFQCILSEGVAMETVPFGLVLSPDYEPHHLTLISIPRGIGQVKLLGELVTVTSGAFNCY